MNAAVQRVDVGTGEVETILHGMSRCDGIRTTQWGTVLATEETDDGAAYEIIDPLTTTGHWIADRGGPGLAADIRDGIDSPSPSQQVVKRTALATQAWEGLDVLDNGVVIGGDELRSGDDNDGGAIFRFVPSVFYACQGAPVRPGQLCDNTISDLSQSPLVSGANYALYHGCNGVGDQGQGCEYGDEGRWVKVNAATARADANLHGATGYCRPEDLHIDRSFGLFDNRPEEGIRWCWTNTCGGSDGEPICAFESSDAVNASLVASLNTGPGIFEFLSTDGSALAEVDTQRFVEADEAGLDLRLSSHDNLDIQPHTSNTYIIEDTSFGDVWACLPDGGDNNERTDGCVAMLSVRDPSAEPTGFVFDGTGQVAFYILQHGQQADSLRDFASNPVDGATDDLVKITGFRVPGDRGRRYSFWLVILGVFVAGAWVSSMVEIRGQLARLNTASRSPDWIAARLVLPEAATQARLAGDASPPRQGDPAGNVATLHGPPSAGGSATRRSSSVPETEREVDSSEIRQALENVLAADPELGAAIEALLNEADADERAVLIESLGDLYPVVVGSPRLPGSTGE